MQTFVKQDKDTKSTNMQSDTDLERELKGAFSKNTDFTVQNLKISVKDAKVTLEGSVEDEAHIQRAAAVAERLPMIKNVDNRIELRSSKHSATPQAEAPLTGPKAAKTVANVSPAGKI